ncbi:MAG: hypothetical protein N3A59_05500 [Thermodesulfovibrionales bacterium]|nr:hypothetical protein [Thermodesulfovibrionales bacterium]
MFKKTSKITVLMIIIFLCCCGKKGDLTLRSQEKPVIIKGFNAIHRDKELYLFWSLQEVEKAKIKHCVLFRSKNNENNFVPLYILQTSENTYKDNSIEFNNTFFYKIKCYTLNDSLAGLSQTLKVSPIKPPPKPQEVYLSITFDEIKLKWQNIEGAKYNVYKSFEKGLYSFTPINKTPINNNYFLDQINKERTVYYQIRALYDSSIRDESSPSEDIEISPDKFIPTPPKGLEVIVLKDKIYLIWDSNPESWIKGYKIYRKIDSQNEFSLLAETSLPIHIDEKTPNKTIYYITAAGPQKESPPSDLLIVQNEKEEKER